MPITDQGELIDRIKPAQALEIESVKAAPLQKSVNFILDAEDLTAAGGGSIFNGYIEKYNNEPRLVRRPGKQLRAFFDNLRNTGQITGLHMFQDTEVGIGLAAPFLPEHILTTLTGDTDEENAMLVVDPTLPIHTGGGPTQNSDQDITSLIPNSSGGFNTLVWILGRTYGSPSATSVYAPANLTQLYMIASNRGGHRSVNTIQTTSTTTPPIVEAGTVAQITAAPAWGARDGFWAHGHSGALYIGGGRNAAGTYLNDVWRSTDGITWTQQTAAAGWSPRADARVIRGNSSSTMILMGGETGSTTTVNDVWKSTDNGVTWTLQTAAAGWSTRTNFGVTYGQTWKDSELNQIIVMGGSGPNPATAITEGRIWYSGDDGATWSSREVTAEKAANVQVTMPTIRALHQVRDRTLGEATLQFPLVAFSDNEWCHFWKYNRLLVGRPYSSNHRPHQGGWVLSGGGSSSDSIFYSYTTSGQIRLAYSKHTNLYRDAQALYPSEFS